MPKYICNDGNGSTEIFTDTPGEAAQEFVDSGDWGEVTSTIWINVKVEEKITLKMIQKIVGLEREVNMDWNGKILVYSSRPDDFTNTLPLPFSEKEKEEIKEKFPKCKFDEIGDLIIPRYEGSFTIAINPEEPLCEDQQLHDWRSPFSVLGGLKENPGVLGNGGGVIIKEVCCNCGKYRVINTWAQNPENGEQGLTSTEYLEADDESLEYTQNCKDL